MKTLVVTGAPTVVIPGLCLRINVDVSRFAFDPREVIDRLCGESHDVTILTLDERHAPAGVRVIVARDFDDLKLRLQYMATTVEYDVVLSLVQLPATRFDGIYSFYNDITSDVRLRRVVDAVADAPALLHFTPPNDDVQEYTRFVCDLRGAGCNASVICLEAIHPVGQQGCNNILEARHELITSGNCTAIIIDDCETDVLKRGTIFVGRNGYVPVKTSRFVEHIAAVVNEAGELAREEREKEG